MDIPGIFLLNPNRVWRSYLGGRMLDALEGKPDPADSHFPEDWIGSTTRAVNKGREHLTQEGYSSVAVGGEQQSLKDVLARFPEPMLGQAHVRRYGANTGFLLKFLDSAIRLHIQCHPTIEFARTHLKSDMGKTEAYVILGIREGVGDPYIYLGFQHPPQPADFRKAILEQDIPFLLSCFEKVPVRPGDAFVVPGGLPHAIGEGILMIEIMEPTDFAVRVEFERGGYVLPEASRFMGRDVDFALSMFDFREMPVQAVRQSLFQAPELLRTYGPGSVEHSVIDRRATPCFHVRRLKVAGRLTKREDSFYIGVVVRGRGRVIAENARYEVQVGDKVLIPFAAGDVVYESDQGMEWILAFPATALTAP